MKIDMCGQTFGELTVLRRSARTDGRNVYWVCACKCGGDAETTTGMLRSGRTSSCGCLAIRRRTERATIHGYADTPVYRVWQSMKNRCRNPNQRAFSFYGGRGITVCKTWAESFESFLADMGTRPEGMSLDRINNNGNYEPGNCRWATMKEQRANRRDSRRLA